LPATTLKYEDCLADPTVLEAIASHFTFDGAAVLAANREVSSKSAQKRQTRSGSDGIFFNKMQAYYFDRYFSEGAISDFMARHQTTLRAFGYGDLVERHLQ
jgi:hypothetical protein